MDVEEFCNIYFVERKGTDSLKWDALAERFGEDGLISLWVADMDFRAPECIQKALRQRIDHGVFGYSLVPDDYYDAFSRWLRAKHHYTLEKEWVRFAPGVVASLYWLIQAFTKEGDTILVCPPVYYPFFNSIKDTKRELIKCDLMNDGGNYTIDYCELEKKIKENQVKMIIHASPHNPVGRVWSEEELVRLLEICKRNEVLCISDEIHGDLILSGNMFQSVLAVRGGEYRSQVIVLNSASKTFNLAALAHSHILIPNPDWRKRYDDYELSHLQVGGNLLGRIATKTAYREGSEWLDALLKVIQHNYDYLKKELIKACPKIGVSPLEGTYLAWIDLRAYLGENTQELIQQKSRLAVDYGEWFGEAYKGFIRMNLATKPENIRKAVKNIIINLKHDSALA